MAESGPWAALLAGDVKGTKEAVMKSQFSVLGDIAKSHGTKELDLTGHNSCRIAVSVETSIIDGEPTHLIDLDIVE
jgi:hypothetical protein